MSVLFRSALNEAIAYEVEVIQHQEPQSVARPPLPSGTVLVHRLGAPNAPSFYARLDELVATAVPAAPTNHKP